MSEEPTWRAPDGSIYARPCPNCGNNNIKTLVAWDYETKEGKVLRRVWHCEKCEHQWKRDAGDPV